MFRILHLYSYEKFVKSTNLSNVVGSENYVERCREKQRNLEQRLFCYEKILTAWNIFRSLWEQGGREKKKEKRHSRQNGEFIDLQIKNSIADNIGTVKTSPLFSFLNRELEVVPVYEGARRCMEVRAGVWRCAGVKCPCIRCPVKR